MKKMYIGCARNTTEIESAVELAATTFCSNNNANVAVGVKKFNIAQGGSFSEQDVVVIVDETGSVHGACFLMDRLFYRGRNKVKGTFLTSICISESSRGRGLSVPLMNYSITEVERRGAAFAILVARRAADYFYNKFNFWGLSQYSKIHLKLADTCSVSEDYSFSLASESDLPEVSMMYGRTYSELYGACERSIEYWKYVLSKADKQGCNFIVRRAKNEINGYVIFSGSEIYEFACARGASCLELLRDFGNHSMFRELILHCSQEHPVLNELHGVDFSLTQRQCDYGGHMVRIVNEAILLSELKKEIQDEISALGVENHSEIQGDALIEVQKGIVDIRLANSPYGYKNTCILMGAEYLSVVLSRPSIYKPRSFNVPLFDQC
jgi:predicted acetyltransferase